MSYRGKRNFSFGEGKALASLPNWTPAQLIPFGIAGALNYFSRGTHLASDRRNEKDREEERGERKREEMRSSNCHRAEFERVESIGGTRSDDRSGRD